MPQSTHVIGLLARVFRDAILPLAVASLLVAFLADPARLDTSELLRNSLLMNTRPIFREVTAFDAIVNSAILLAAAITGAIAVGAVRDRLGLVQQSPAEGVGLVSEHSRRIAPGLYLGDRARVSPQ